MFLCRCGFELVGSSRPKELGLERRSPAYRATGVAPSCLLPACSSGGHSLASIAVPDAAAMMASSSLDRISPVTSSPRADWHRVLTLSSHRMARSSGSPVPSLARNSRNTTHWFPSSRGCRQFKNIGLQASVSVIPAKAGIQNPVAGKYAFAANGLWIPAFAGMTVNMTTPPRNMTFCSPSSGAPSESICLAFSLITILSAPGVAVGSCLSAVHVEGCSLPSTTCISFFACSASLLLSVFPGIPGGHGPLLRLGSVLFILPRVLSLDRS